MSDDRKATLSFDQQAHDFAIQSPDPRQRCDCIQKHWAAPVAFTLSILVLNQPLPANLRSPTLMATKAKLLYRGYPIDQLAFDGDYMDVCYALMYGEFTRSKT